MIVAVPWFGLAGVLRGSEQGALGDLVAREATRASSSIVSVNLWLERGAMPSPFVGLPQRTFQWMFDKRWAFGETASHFTLVASGADDVLRQSNDELADLALAEAREALPDLRQAKVQRIRVVREPNATFSLAAGRAAAAWHPDRRATACCWPATGPTPACRRRSKAPSCRAMRPPPPSPERPALQFGGARWPALFTFQEHS